jgi:Terpene cyclase DEP1
MFFLSLEHTMTRKQLYLVFAIIGTIIPWIFFADFFSNQGFNLPLFFRSLFVNSVAGGFSVDLLISILLFWIWSFYDAKKHHVKHWWIVLPTASCVGLALALALYLYFREDVSA